MSNNRKIVDIEEARRELRRPGRVTRLKDARRQKARRDVILAVTVDENAWNPVLLSNSDIGGPDSKLEDDILSSFSSLRFVLKGRVWETRAYRTIWQKLSAFLARTRLLHLTFGGFEIYYALYKPSRRVHILSVSPKDPPEGGGSDSGSAPEPDGPIEDPRGVLRLPQLGAAKALRNAAARLKDLPSLGRTRKRALAVANLLGSAASFAVTIAAALLSFSERAGTGRGPARAPDTTVVLLDHPAAAPEDWAFTDAGFVINDGAHRTSPYRFVAPGGDDMPMVALDPGAYTAGYDRRENLAALARAVYFRVPAFGVPGNVGSGKTTLTSGWLTVPYGLRAGFTWSPFYGAYSPPARKTHAHASPVLGEQDHGFSFEGDTVTVYFTLTNATSNAEGGHDDLWSAAWSPAGDVEGAYSHALDLYTGAANHPGDDSVYVTYNGKPGVGFTIGRPRMLRYGPGDLLRSFGLRTDLDRAVRLYNQHVRQSFFTSALNEEGAAASDIANTRAVFTLGTTIFESAVRAGLPAAVARTLTAIYSAKIDHAPDRTKDASLEVLFDGTNPGAERVKYAVLRVGDVVMPVYFYAQGANQAFGYYDSEGVSVETRLLSNPVDGVGVPTERNGKGLGDDFALPFNTPVVAAAAGVLTTIETDNDGINVRIDAGHGLTFAYRHLSQLAPGVREGSHLEEGSPVGSSGGADRRKATPLHFEAWLNDAVIDPLTARSPASAGLSGTALADFIRIRKETDAAVARAPLQKRDGLLSTLSLLGRL